MFSQYGELQTISGLPIWVTPANFNGFLRVGFVTAPTSLNGGQPNFARSLAVSWDGTLYIHFGALAP